MPGAPREETTTMTIRNEYRDHVGQISKSLAKSSECETYYAEYQLRRDPAPDMGNPLRDTGTAWHSWRAWCYRRMTEECAPYDMAWNQEWLAENATSPDARQLIASDWPNVDHDSIAAFETFLSVDENWQPLDVIYNATPGRRSPTAYAGGTLDLMLMPDPEEAYLKDGKTGWSTATVFADEGVVYAALVFAHYTGVRRVYWQWEFPRLKWESKPIVYTREQFEDGELQRIVASWRNRIVEIVEKVQAGKTLEANPFSAACPGCQIMCPHRTRAISGPAFNPPTKAAEAAEIAGAIRTAEIYASNARKMLANYLDTHGPVECASGYVAELQTKERSSYPLKTTLEALGAKVTDPDARWKLDLDKLRMGGSEIHAFAKAKMRAGLFAVLDAVAVKSPVTTLKISRKKLGED